MVGKREQSTDASLHETMCNGASREVLHLLRKSDATELQKALCKVSPSVMEQMQGRDGYRAKRFLFMREDILPQAWADYFKTHASNLFNAEMDHDVVLRSALLTPCPARSVETNLAPTSS